LSFADEEDEECHREGLVATVEQRRCIRRRLPTVDVSVVLQRV